MRYPVNEWSKWYNAQSFGAQTNYGYHDGEDLNLKTGGNTDLGQPILCVAAGQVTSVHNHTGQNTFGNHVHVQHDGAWGTVYSHYAHCQTISVQVGQIVSEGQQIATVGKSGTTLAHLHFAIKLQPTGIDGIARTKTELLKWTDPIVFIQKWAKEPTVTNDLLTLLDYYAVKDIPELKHMMDEQLAFLKSEREINKSLTMKNIQFSETNASLGVNNETLGNQVEQEHNAAEQSKNDFNGVWEVILKNSPTSVKKGDLSSFVTYLTACTQNEDKIIELTRQNAQDKADYDKKIKELTEKLNSVRDQYAGAEEKLVKLEQQIKDLGSTPVVTVPSQSMLSKIFDFLKGVWTIKE